MNVQSELKLLPTMRPMGRESIAALKTEAAVIKAIAAMSGLPDKALADKIGTDPSILSKAKLGMARLPESSINALMDEVGSEDWLAYWLFQRGYDPASVRKLETESERAARIANERADEERRLRLEAERRLEEAQEFMRGVLTGAKS